MLLNHKIAMVTGGSTGIGAEIVRLFASEGALVLIVCSRSIAAAEALSREVEKNGGKAVCFQADLTKEAEVSALFEQVREQYGSLDILVNNAGRTYNIAFDDITQDTFRRDIDVNLTSTVLCSKYAAPLFGEQGWIVNTTSIRGMTDSGRPGIMGYCAAKAGLISFTKNLALELAPNIRVNAVAPGFVRTEYLDRETPQSLKDSWLAQIPTGEFVDIQELAKVYLMLATNRAMTGAVIPVDGGYTILNR